MGAPDWDFFDLQVTRVRALGPSMVRISFGGGDLDRFRSGGRDQRFKLFLPQPGQPAPEVPTQAGTEWFAAWRALPAERRAVMRSYTVRAQRPGELAVDFALHGSAPGPAGRWAAAARPGDRVVVLGPTAPDNAGVDFRPPPGTDWVLLAADLTALPAVAGILATLEPERPVRVWIETPDPADRQQLPSPARDLAVHWTATGGLLPAIDAVPAEDLPAGTGYAWIAGEAGTVRALRRHLIHERGLDRRRITFTGYWRRGAGEEQLLDEVLSEAS